MPGELRCCLFGGTLLAAGLIAPAARGQSFSFDYSASYVGIMDVNTNESVVRDYAYGAGFLSVFAGAGTSYAAADLSADRISSRAVSMDDHYLAAGFNFFSYFQVSHDMLATVQWDFQADLDGRGSRLDIYAPNAGVLFSESAMAGSAKVQFYAGQTYHLEGSVFAGAGSNGAAYYQIIVPSPGAAGLLGIAGLTAARRRRAPNLTE